MPIAASFHSIRDRVVASVDAKLAEPVLLAFLQNGSADPDRVNQQVVAVLRTGEEKADDGRSSRDRNVRVSAGGGVLRIDRARYPDVVLKAGDKVRAIARAGEPWFEILTVDDRSHSRLIANLGDA